MFSIITLPTGFLDDIYAVISTLFTDLSGYIALVVGVLLGALVLEIVIGAIRK